MNSLATDIQREVPREEQARRAIKTISSSKLVNVLDVLIMSRLWFRPMNGYEVRKEISSAYGVRVSFGTLYPHLHSLEQGGFISLAVISGSSRKRKKVYSLTAKGGELLVQTVRNLEKITKELSVILPENSTLRKTKL